MDPRDGEITAEEMRRRTEAILDNLRREVLLLGDGHNVDHHVPLRLPLPRSSPGRNGNTIQGAVSMAVLLGLFKVRLIGIWGLGLLSVYLWEYALLTTSDEPYDARAFEVFHSQIRALILHAITLSLMPLVHRGISWTISAMTTFPHLSTSVPQSARLLAQLLLTLVIFLSIVWLARGGALPLPRRVSEWRSAYSRHFLATFITVAILESLRGVQTILNWCRRLYAKLAGVFPFLTLRRSLPSLQPYSSSKPWVYRPLTQGRQIRLIRLHCWIPVLGVRATITHVNLENPPPYDAISYHWGTSEERRRLNVLDETDASSTPKWLEVSKPTYDALYSLSSPWKTRMVWIDAVCIDQSPHTSNTEKGPQVMLMREIYGKASRVIVYLGNSILAPAAHSLIHELILMRSAGCSGSELYQVVSRGEGMSVRWVALIQLLSRPWFSRVWVVQEVAAASLNPPRIWYGGRVYDWVSLLDAFELLEYFEMTGFLHTIHQGRVAVNHLQSMRSMDDMRKGTFLVDVNRWSKGLMENPAPLSYLLESTMAHQASDARDKVFALLGLMGEDPPPTLTPDYSSETTAESVYIKTAKYLLTDEKPLAFLQLAGVGVSRRHQALPSWVPDWVDSPDRGASMSPTLWDKSHVRYYYRATGSARPVFSINRVGEREALTLSCTRVDTLTHLGAVHTPAIEDDEFVLSAPGTFIDSRDMLDAYRWHEETLAMVLGSHAPDPYPGGRQAPHPASTPPAGHRQVDKGERSSLGSIPSQPLREVFWRVLTGDLNMRWMTRPAPTSRQDDYNNWVSFMAEMAGYLTADSRDTHIPVHDAAFWRRHDAGLPFANAMARCAVGRRVCVTAAGRLGCAPPLCQVGDEVVLVHGAPTPFVIRKTSAETGAESDLYELVGPCYVHGIMDGEANGTRGAEQLVFV
ncbi:hypothetical protein RB595_009007 [Gaeumannomyces hyphopodioides]